MINKTTSLIIFALMSFSISACSNDSKKVSENIQITEVIAATDTPAIGEKIEGYYDHGSKYWIAEDGLGYETYPIDHLPQYTSINKVDSERNTLGSGFLNSKTGEIVIPPKYFGMDLQFTNGFCRVADKDQKWGFVNEEGYEIVAPQYNHIWLENITDSLIKVSKDGKQGYINTKGKIIIPVEYMGLGEASEGMISFANEPQRWGYLNYKNEVIVEPLFSHDATFKGERVTIQKPDGESYHVYKNGRIEKQK